jgi:hypothetical protein
MPPSMPPSQSPLSHLASVRENGSKKIAEESEKNEGAARKTAAGSYNSLSTQQQQQDASGASHLPLNTSAQPSTTALDPYNSVFSPNNNMSYGGGGMGGMGGMYGGGMGGMYGGGMGMGGMGMGGMGMGMPPMMGGPLSNLNQFLFGIQNVLSSLGQAVQIVGMNTQAVKQLLEAATAMFDHAVASYSEMRVIEAAAGEFESEEDKKRRRRLRALRWAMVTAATYAGYKCIKWLFSSSRRRHQRPMLEGQPSTAMGGYSAPYRPYSSDPYAQQPAHNGSYGSSPYGGGYSYGGSGQGYGY